MAFDIFYSSLYYNSEDRQRRVSVKALIQDVAPAWCVLDKKEYTTPFSCTDERIHFSAGSRDSRKSGYYAFQALLEM